MECFSQFNKLTYGVYTSSTYRLVVISNVHIKIKEQSENITIHNSQGIIGITMVFSSALEVQDNYVKVYQSMLYKNKYVTYI